jgi:hypothetical protein
LSKEDITCTECGHTFIVGIPSGKEIGSVVKNTFLNRRRYQSWHQLEVACPKKKEKYHENDILVLIKN